jgi:transcriptional regulator with XRE-family HTH domain
MLMTTGKKVSKARRQLEAIAGPLTLAALIAAIREGEEMSQVELSKKLEVSRAHLCDVEKGRRNVGPARAAQWAKILGYSEKQFIRLALQALVDAEGLDCKVSVA